MWQFLTLYDWMWFALAGFVLMATAVMVAGQDGAKWFGQPQLAGYQVFAVTRHEQTAWSI
jgi:hypothetical protein